MKSEEPSDEQVFAVVGVRQLTEQQAAQARDLRDLCNRADGLDLKLGIASTFMTQAAEPYAFLCTVDGVLAGFCTLLGGDDPELELCGIVHPAYRRRGIGRALLRAAMDSARRRLAAIRVLLICEDASISGRAFVATVGGKHSFSEIRMEIAAEQLPSAIQSPLDLREATSADAPELARVIGDSFGQAHLVEDVIRDMSAEGERYFLASKDGVPVGAFKIFIDRPKAYIYAFGVPPAYRRNGYGRAMLENILPRLFQEGWTAVGLEVDADNAPAQALYHAVGFHEVTIYGYYMIDITA